MKHRKSSHSPVLPGCLGGGLCPSPPFYRGELLALLLCLPFPTGETSSIRFTVTLVLLSSLAFLLMVIICTKFYCNLDVGKVGGQAGKGKVP